MWGQFSAQKIEWHTSTQKLSGGRADQLSCSCSYASRHSAIAGQVCKCQLKPSGGPIHHKISHSQVPEALRAYFFPRQTIQIQEAARIIGVGPRSPSTRGNGGGDESLKIRKRPGNGRQFILLDDLISYLFPSSIPENPELQTTSPENYTNGVAVEGKKRGRPRGSKNKPKVSSLAHAQEGGMP